MRKKLFTEIPYIKGERLVLKQVTKEDAGALKEMVSSDAVYRLEPTFLFERKYEDVNYVIDHLYDECFKESIILGIYLEGEFCGLAEFYGYKDFLQIKDLRECLGSWDLRLWRMILMRTGAMKSRFPRINGSDDTKNRTFATGRFVVLF